MEVKHFVPAVYQIPFSISQAAKKREFILSFLSSFLFKFLSFFSLFFFFFSPLIQQMSIGRHQDRHIPWPHGAYLHPVKDWNKLDTQPRHSCQCRFSCFWCGGGLVTIDISIYFSKAAQYIFYAKTPSI